MMDKLLWTGRLDDEMRNFAPRCAAPLTADKRLVVDSDEKPYVHAMPGQYVVRFGNRFKVSDV